MQRLIQIQVSASKDEIAQAIATASAHECTGIELACAWPDLSDSTNSQSVSGLIDHCAQHGLGGCNAVCLGRFDSGCLVGDDVDTRRSALRELQQIVETAARLGASRLSLSPAVVCACDSSHVFYQDALNRTFDRLSAVVRHLERCGVTVALRAARNGFLMSPPELRDFICRLNSHAIGADVDAQGRDDRASVADWLATLGNLTQAIGVSTGDNADLDSVESAFRRYAPAAHQSAQFVLRPQPGRPSEG